MVSVNVREQKTVSDAMFNTVEFEKRRFNLRYGDNRITNNVHSPLKADNMLERNASQSYMGPKFDPTSVEKLKNVVNPNNTSRYEGPDNLRRGKTRQRPGFTQETTPKKVAHVLQASSELNNKALANEFETFVEPRNNMNTYKLGSSERFSSSPHGTKSSLPPNKYLEMCEKRELLAQKYIEENKMDDPNRKYDIQNARCLVGECKDMCPEYERYEREYQNGLMEFEKIPGTNRVDHKRAVKRYRRSAAGDEMPLPSDVRPLFVLRKTLDYLMYEIVDKHGLENSYNFVRDRTRAIRKDITLQNIANEGSIFIYETIARYHLLCSYRLCNKIDIKQEYEQLEKTLQSLIELYDECIHMGIKSEKEAEFRAYYMLHYAFNRDVQANFEAKITMNRPELLNNELIMYAIRLRGLLSTTNAKSLSVKNEILPANRFSKVGAFESFSEVFRIISDPSFPYLMACAFHPHIKNVRLSALEAMKSAFYILPSKLMDSLTSLTWLERILCYDTMDDVVGELESVGIETQTFDGVVKAYIGKIKENKTSNNFFKKPSSEDNRSRNTLKITAPMFLLESKAHKLPDVDIIYGKVPKLSEISNTNIVSESGQKMDAIVKNEDVISYQNNNINSIPKITKQSYVSHINKNHFSIPDNPLLNESNEKFHPARTSDNKLIFNQDTPASSDKLPMKSDSSSQLHRMQIHGTHAIQTINSQVGPNIHQNGLSHSFNDIPETSKLDFDTIINLSTFQNPSSDSFVPFNSLRDATNLTISDDTIKDPHLLETKNVFSVSDADQDRFNEKFSNLFRETPKSSAPNNGSINKDSEKKFENDTNVSNEKPNTVESTDKSIEDKTTRAGMNWKYLAFFAAIKYAKLQRYLDNRKCILVISKLNAPSLFADKTLNVPVNNPLLDISHSNEYWWATIDPKFTNKVINISEIVKNYINSEWKEPAPKINHTLLPPSHVKLVLYVPDRKKDKESIFAENWLKSFFMLKSSITSTPNVLQHSFSRVTNFYGALDVHALVIKAKMCCCNQELFKADEKLTLSGASLFIFSFAVFKKGMNKEKYFNDEKNRIRRFFRLITENVFAYGNPTPVLVVFWYSLDLTVDEYRKRVIHDGNLINSAKHANLKLMFLEINFHSTVMEIKKYSKKFRKKVESVVRLINGEPLLLPLKGFLLDRNETLMEKFFCTDFNDFVNRIAISNTGRVIDVMSNMKILNFIIKAFNSIVDIIANIVCRDSWSKLNWPPYEFTQEVISEQSITPNMKNNSTCILSTNYDWNSEKKLREIHYTFMNHKLDHISTDPQISPENQFKYSECFLSVGDTILDEKCREIYFHYVNWVSSLCRKQQLVPQTSETSIYLKLKFVISAFSKRRADIVPFPYDKICSYIFPLIVLQLEYKLFQIDNNLQYPALAFSTMPCNPAVLLNNLIEKSVKELEL